MGKLDTNPSKIEEQFKLWDAKLDVLVAKAKVAEKEAKIDLGKRIEAIKANRATAQSKYEEYKAAGSGKWDDFKSGVEGVWKDIEDAFKDLVK